MTSAKWVVLIIVGAFTNGSKGASTSNKAAPANRIGLERPTDQPVTISEPDLDSLINNLFATVSEKPEPGYKTVKNFPTLATTTPQVPSYDPFPDNNRPVTIRPDEHFFEGKTDEDCQCVPFYQCNTNKTIIENGEGLIDIRIKAGSCEDYMEVCCKVEDTREPNQPITPGPSIPPEPPAALGCGQRNNNGVRMRITGDDNNEAQFGEFPWVVAIIKKEGLLNVYKCAGSLISSEVVLTAAHCVKGMTDLSVRAGEWDTQRILEPLPAQNRAVSGIVIHEEYHAGALFNDIALLFLESPVEQAPNVAPICLPAQEELIDARDCVASGWGKDEFGKEGKYQVILKKVELPIVSRDGCIEALRKTRLGRHFNLHPSFICAGGEPGKDTCTGDGGAPLVCPSREDPNKYVQAGIVAWGIGCGTETPGVYSDVAYFRNWIENQISARNIGSKTYSQSGGI